MPMYVHGCPQLEFIKSGGLQDFGGFACILVKHEPTARNSFWDEEPLALTSVSADAMSISDLPIEIAKV